MAKLIDSTDEYKLRIREYLEKSGIQIENKKVEPKCICFAHDEKTPSMVVYDDHVNCYGCGFNGDIFDVAGKLHNLSEFKDQASNVKEVLGYADPSKKKAPVKKTVKAKKIESFPVSFPKDKALEIYTPESIQKIGKSFGELKTAWPYTDKDNNIIALDVRFEKGKEKNVITFWHDGKSIKVKNSPNLIFNLYEILNTDKPILIHEGSKCADIGIKNLPEFCHTTWNRGTHSVLKVDWTILKDKKVFILRDNDSPGLDCANKIRDKLPNAILIKIYPGIKSVKGGDIEDILKVTSPEKLTEYILSHEKKKRCYTEKRRKQKFRYRNQIPFQDTWNCRRRIRIFPN
jgi:5S rRNA maturation endonuclease (ribonuclease M5)